MNSSYFSQNGQDVYLDELFRKQTNGLFLDIGAYDGVKYSNTNFLEKYRKWTGICIEANDLIYPSLESNRECITVNAAIGSKDEMCQFTNITGDSIMLSGLTKEFDSRHQLRIMQEVHRNNGSYSEQRVQCFRIAKILERYPDYAHIDYCSIDTEGSELSVLSSFDFAANFVSVFSIENTYKKEEIYNFMKNHDYKYIHRIGEDDFFIANNQL